MPTSTWKQKREEKLVLVNPVTRDATCVSPLTSSDFNEHENNILTNNRQKIYDVSSINNVISNKNLLEDIKKNFENDSSNNIISSRKLMEDIKKTIEKETFIVNSSLRETTNDDLAPPLPLHRSFNNLQLKKIVKKENNHPILPQKPKLAVMPTILVAKQAAISTKQIDSEREKSVSVKKLAAKFNN